MNNASRKTKNIAYRVSEEDFAEIEKAAIADGKNPNDWCREIVMQKISAKENSAPPSSIEHITFEEIAKLRYLIGIGFGLLSTDELTKKSWDETKFQVDNFGEKIAGQLLARRKKK